MIEGKLRIADEDYALELLSNVHREDPRRPIRELVENSVDAESTSMSVVVNKRASDPYIMCRDNGEGISLKVLIEVPQRICDSIKRRMKMKTGGVHGIGLLSFYTIGNRLRIISRSKSSADSNALEIEGLKKYRQISVERPLEQSGTEVYIYGIEKERKLLNAERLAEYLADEFEDGLLEGKFKLEIQQDSRRIPVTRERLMVGTPIIIDRRISTEWGDIIASIYYGGKGGVALTRRGITIVNNLAGLPDLEGEVWRSGKVSGAIRFDSINVSTDKKNPIRDDVFKGLVARVQELEPEITDWIRKLEESEKEKSKERLYKYLASRLDEVLRELNFDRIKALMEAGKKAGREMEAEIGKGVAFTGGENKAEKKVGRPPTSKGDVKRLLRSAYGINWMEESDLEHPKSRSRFDHKFGTIYVNKAHPDFVKKVLNAKNDFEELDYYYKITAKELVLHQFDGAPAPDVVEKLLDIQFAMEKSPPAL